MTAPLVFSTCVKAIMGNILITKLDQNDKEFHFQNWFKDRLESTQLNYDTPGRNSFPDFAMVDSPEGYEIKGLAYPGRDKTYDGNSQVPKGHHNGRDIYYVFGRYPKTPDGNRYPVLDFIICHGSFLNAKSDYVHLNKSAKGFGSYGDIMIRDRKMYVIPTPYNIANGLAHHNTLILPANIKLGKEFIVVGELIRKETTDLLASYNFNLNTNALNVEKIKNPNAGKKHLFRAWRLKEHKGEPVKMRSIDIILDELEKSIENNNL